MSVAFPLEYGQATNNLAINNIRAAIDTLRHANGVAGPTTIGRQRSYSLLRSTAQRALAIIACGTPEAASRGTDRFAERVQGRTHAREMGLLSLAALTFATLKDAQAADANVTILDEDRISYKDLAHGSFELVTKEAVPRYIIVEDPGETIVLSRTGSSISVYQSANSTARMEELQAAQQEAYANLAKGLGPGGSGTTPFSDSTLPVQPINFTLPTDPAQINSLPPLPAVETKAEFIFIPATVPQPPPTLTLALGSGPTETDTVVFDTFAATSGTFQASSSEGGATLAYGINGGTPGNTILNGVHYDVSQAHDYGTLYVNSATGEYTFVPDDAAINALKAPTTENFVVTVSDGTTSASQAFTIGIDGVNDDAIIAGNTTGSVNEDAGTAGLALFAAAHAHAPRVATGTLTSTDVDDPANAFIAVDTPKTSNGGYGTFTMTANGSWSYTLDDSNCTVQALNVGDSLTDTFTVTTVDGTEQLVTIVIGGKNDPAVISGDVTGSVVEAACKDPGTPLATGTLTATDVDNPSTGFTPVKCQESDNGYGTFTMTADGVWTYKLDNDNCTVQSLDDCDSLTDTFTVTTEDGTKQVITITIQGADDAHGHHSHSWHDLTYKTFSGSPEVETVLASEASPGVAGADAQTTDVVTSDTSSNEVSKKAAVEVGFASGPEAAHSFKFAEAAASNPALDADLPAGILCVQAASDCVATVHDAPGVADAIQACDPCTSQQGSGFLNAALDIRMTTGHVSHDLVV